MATIVKSAYSCIIFYVKHRKLPFLAVVTWFPILGKIQDGGKDGDHCWWRHRPAAALTLLKYTFPCQEDQRFLTEGKIVSKYCNISKTPRRGSIHPPPPCTTAGVWICVYVRGLKVTRTEMEASSVHERLPLPKKTVLPIFINIFRNYFL